LLLSPSADACKQAFMGQLKEADFMRWGNTKRMTGLRKAEQDGMWEGVKEHNFDDYWRVASKITPTTTPNRPSSPPPVPPSSASMHGRPSTAEAQQEKEGAYSVRSVPVRVYLPDGPVMQELVPPVLEDAMPHTLTQYLSTSLPLLFPTAPLPTHTHTLPLSRSQQPLPAPPSLAYALIQGVLAPPDAEMAWLGACMAGADGWVNVCVGIVRDSFGR
jgi:autophagy-related protein 5